MMRGWKSGMKIYNINPDTTVYIKDGLCVGAIFKYENNLFTAAGYHSKNIRDFDNMETLIEKTNLKKTEYMLNKFIRTNHA